MMRTVRAVLKKELTDALRDGRTLFFTLVLPLVIYPLLFFVAGRLEGASDSRQRHAPTQVAVAGLEHAPALSATLAADSTLQVVPAQVGPEAVRDGAIHVLVEVPAGHERSVLAGEPSTVVIHYDAGAVLSRRSLDRVEAALDSYQQKLVAGALERAGQPAALAAASERREINVGQAGGAEAWALLVPYLLVLLIASGASHTAIDMTAGEKERGTLETILATAAPRAALVTGKFMAVVAMASTAALAGFLGLLAAGAVPASGLGQAFLPGRVALPQALAILAMLLPTAAFLSALFLAVGCFARGAREGQTYSSYLIMVVIMLAMASVVIDFDVAPGFFAVPVLGTTMALRQLLAGSGHGLLVVVSLVSTLAATCVLLWLAARLFAAERVMFRK